MNTSIEDPCRSVGRTALLTAGTPGPIAPVVLIPTRCSVQWVVLKNDLSPFALEPGKLELELRLQGRDQPGRLATLAQPFRDAGLNIEAIRYDVVGPQREYYQALIQASGPPDRVKKLHEHFEQRRLEYTANSAGTVSPRTRTVQHPWLIEVRFTLPDEAGITADLCHRIAFDYLLRHHASGGGGAGLHCQNASFIRLQGRVLCLNAHLAGEASYPQGGVPGFQVSARIATVSKEARERVAERVQQFQQDKLGIWLERQDLPEVPRIFRPIPPRRCGNRRSLPTQFLNEAAVALNN